MILGLVYEKAKELKLKNIYIYIFRNIFENFSQIYNFYHRNFEKKKQRKEEKIEREKKLKNSSRIISLNTFHNTITMEATTTKS